jgi:hypothetical protein
MRIGSVNVSQLDLPMAGCPPAELVDKWLVARTIRLSESSEILRAHLEAAYNLTPDPGEVAKLGFTVGSDFAYEGDITVRPGDYGLRATFYNANEVLTELESVSLTLWGVPADTMHDSLRWDPEDNGSGVGTFGATTDAAQIPFLSLPTSCSSTPLHASFTVDSWENPGENIVEPMGFGPLIGCDRLVMEPSLIVEPSSNKASSATGLVVDTSIPQTYDNPEGLATSTLKRAVVRLPEGMTLNPSAGAGVGACSEAQYLEEGPQPLPGKGCSNESKLGTIKVSTPSLREEVLGSVFLPQPAPFGEPGHSPFNSLIAVYLVARIPNRGVIVKAVGKVQANALTGQLVTTFDDLPPLPFDLLTFRFHSGATAPLVTPPLCGAYSVASALTPLSATGEGATVFATPFLIVSGFDGGSCPSGGVSPFVPQAVAGTENNAAGSYSPLYTRIVRNDGEQEITGVSFNLPPGLTANLTGIPFCPDADIQLAREKTGAQEEASPSCPAASEIGQSLAGAGVGSVLAQAPGKIYLGGPFEGAPFSVVAEVRAKVGPFDLGTVVVRFALRVNPTTAQVEVDSTGSDPIPHIIKGIVVHVRDIRVYIDRPGFTLNPTSCAPMSFAATVVGSGADFANHADYVPVTVTDPFQVADCQALKFKPGFKVSTSGKTSRKNGADLSVKLTYPVGSLGTQANIHSVKVDLPKQLPSRLTTLQKACTAATFEANPALCPTASVVGHATAITPILPVPLVGPAYFVSHGGAKFPELIIVLQGYGVTIDLRGETFISKAGITSSTFSSVPDQPVTSFELTLPAGPYSALAANLPPSAKGSFCGEKLVMPTAFAAQNGAEIHQNTPISVTGCAKHVVKKKKGRGKAKKTSPKRK